MNGIFFSFEKFHVKFSAGTNASVPSDNPQTSLSTLSLERLSTEEIFPLTRKEDIDCGKLCRSFGKNTCSFFWRDIDQKVDTTLSLALSKDKKYAHQHLLSSLINLPYLVCLLHTIMEVFGLNAKLTGFILNRQI